MAVELPDLLAADAAAWRAWLALHHGDWSGVRLVLAKKDTSKPTSLTYDEAPEEALCFGWIDGQEAADPAARAAFDELDSRNRYAVLYRVTTAKKPETRVRRIDTLVAMLARGETIHPRTATSSAASARASTPAGAPGRAARTPRNRA